MRVGYRVIGESCGLSLSTPVVPGSPLNVVSAGFHCIAKRRIQLELCKFGLFCQLFSRHFLSGVADLLH